jgi:hypothetical protein
MIVEENNLTQQISLLRKLLGEPGQSMIETIPRRGYRFAATVRLVDDAVPVTQSEVKRSFSWRPWIVAAASVAVIIIAIVIMRMPRGDVPRTIAVLPFKRRNWSGRRSSRIGMDIERTGAFRRFSANCIWGNGRD